MSGTSVPTNETGKIIVKGASEWEAVAVDDVTVEVDSTLGLQLKDGGITADKLVPVTQQLKISGASLYSLGDIPAGAGDIPGHCLDLAPSNLPSGSENDIIVKGASDWEVAPIDEATMSSGAEGARELGVKVFGITGAQVATGAVDASHIQTDIPDTKLASISGASKVSGASLYDLHLIDPAKNLAIPVANLSSAVNGGVWSDELLYNGFVSSLLVGELHVREQAGSGRYLLMLFVVFDTLLPATLSKVRLREKGIEVDGTSPLLATPYGMGLGGTSVSNTGCYMMTPTNELGEFQIHVSETGNYRFYLRGYLPLRG